MDTLTQIKDHLASISDKMAEADKRHAEVDKRQAILEIGHNHLLERLEGLERRFLDGFDDIKSAMMERFSDITHILKDNGQIGLVTRVTNLEAKRAAQDTLQRESDRFWSRVSPFIPWIAAILGAAGMYFVKK